MSTSSPLSCLISISDGLLPRNQQVQRDQLRQFHAAHLEYLLHQVSENRQKTVSVNVSIMVVIVGDI